ncbi:hypothetical protein [Streptomyces nigra]
MGGEVRSGAGEDGRSGGARELRSGAGGEVRSGTVEDGRSGAGRERALA